MSDSSFLLVSPGISMPQAPAVVGARRTRLRALAAVALLAALGALTASSLIASGDEWSLARAREYAPPAAHGGPIDPDC